MPDATMTPVAVAKMKTIYAHIVAVVITQLPTFHRSWWPDPRRRPNEHAENHAAQRVATASVMRIMCITNEEKVPDLSSHPSLAVALVVSSKQKSS